jgi:hypothetical protein
MTCILCRGQLNLLNVSGVCLECQLLVRNLLRVEVPERWRDHPDGQHIVSDRGRVARLLNVDRGHRYPRISVGGVKRYLHAFVAEAWHGERPDGALVLHYDDDPENPTATNLRYGSHVENAADRKRNRQARERKHRDQPMRRLPA